MMAPISDFEIIVEGVFWWHGFNPECRTGCSSTAIRTPDGIVILDPLRLEEESFARMIGGERVAAILLTNGNHVRDAAYARERFGCPLCAPAGARGEVDADHWVRDGDVLYQSLRAIALPGGGCGETAYLAPGVLVLGDALIHLTSLEILPDKYCHDPKQLRQSLQVLVPLIYDAASFAHGPPLRTGARDGINQLLSSHVGPPKG